MPFLDLTETERRALEERLRVGLAISEVPPHLHDGLLRYFGMGILPGSFLQAVLCSDLVQVIGRADPAAWRGLPATVLLLLEWAPASAWGSRDAVLAWTVTPERLEI